jgi:hypothetical protein
MKSLEVGLLTYLRIENQQPPIRICVFQDNCVNVVSKIRYCDDSVIEENKKIINDFNTNCQHLGLQNKYTIDLFEQKDNVGIGINQWNGYLYAFEKMGADSAIFLEDDVILSKYFLFYFTTTLKQFRDTQDISAISLGFENHKIPDLIRASNNDLSRSSLVILKPTGSDHSWAYATWSDRFFKIKNNYKKYIDFISTIDYRTKKQHKDSIMKIFKEILPDNNMQATSQDAARQLSFIAGGYTSMLIPVLRRAIPIGREGIHFTKDSFKYDDTTDDITHYYDVLQMDYYLI